jgi:ribosome-associated toxin RatA of RatAB toxin-antitoxin module
VDEIMTFEEFLAACNSTQVVSTTEGTALLIGTTVIQFKGDSWAEYFAKALRMIPTEKIDA